MFPYFTFLGQIYYLYALLGLLALFVASGVAYIRAQKVGLGYFDMLMCIVFLSAGLTIGGSILHALVNIPVLWSNQVYFFDAPFLFLRLAFGGLVFYGGLIGALIAMPLYAKYIKVGLSTLIVLIIPVFPLAHGIMRVGCFMAGCCYGIEHEQLGIAFTRSLSAPNDINLLPVQLIEVVANFLIFVALWQYTKKPRQPLYVLCFYGLSYAAIRFMLEFLRGDDVRGYIFLFSTSQFISVFLVIFCIGALIYEKYSLKKITPPPV